LGLAGYYRRFVRDFSAIALPLTELTRTLSTRKLAAHWGTRQQLAFVQLKRSLQEAPVLTLPDPARPFVVHCDASGYAVGAVLQQDRGKGLQPVAYMSRKMSGAETRYPVHEQELLAIIEALTAWRHHLQGAAHPVTVRTDHKSLEHFQTQPMLSGRQTRWLDTLALFDYRIEYVKGPDNSAADALSRRGDHAAAGVPTERPPAFVDDRRTFVAHCIWTEESDELAEELHRIGVEERRGGRTRTLAVQREREEARRAATYLVPAAEVNSPPPNQHGARVTATQRCTANNRSGGQCACRTARGQYCWVHQRAVEGTRIKAATMPAAGKGLFAAREFAAGEHIADYSGDEALLRSAADGGLLRPRGGLEKCC
jgi:ribonuclease HI